ncbi:MAG: cmk [Bacteroidetes bacterium]|nr:cmk [Bacteroidota bacterium]
MTEKINIAIDGHSSCGKSTIAKGLAQKIGYTYIDSGAMYRAVALYCIQNGLIKDGVVDESALKTKIQSLQIEFRPNTTGGADTYLNDKNVESEIRSLEAASAASKVSTLKFVRQTMVYLQQQMGKNKGVVMDGRDIGTVVFPDAELKLFVTAKPEVRADRRYKELINKGLDVEYNDVLANVIERDERDSNRAESPLRQAKDSVVLDNSDLTPEQQFEWTMVAYQKAIDKVTQTDQL